MQGDVFQLATAMNDWLLDPMDLLSHLLNASQDYLLGEENGGVRGRRGNGFYSIGQELPMLTSCISSYTNMTTQECDTCERSPGTGCKRNVA